MIKDILKHEELDYGRFDHSRWKGTERSLNTTYRPVLLGKGFIEA